MKGEPEREFSLSCLDAGDMGLRRTSISSMRHEVVSRPCLLMSKMRFVVRESKYEISTCLEIEWLEECNQSIFFEQITGSRN